MKTKKIKTILFNPVHPVKKFAVALLLGAGLGLSLSGAAHAYTTTGTSVIASADETYTSRTPASGGFTGNYFEFLQLTADRTLTVTAPYYNVTGGGGALRLENGGTVNTAGSVIFASNGAASGGGAIAFNANLSSSKYNGFITHSDSGTLAFVGNTTGGGSSGAAVYASGSLTLSGSYGAIMLVSNTAGYTGGAFYANNDITWHSLVSNTLAIVGNRTAERAGGALGGYNVTLSGSFGAILVSSNTAGASGYYDTGGAFYAAGNLTLSATVARNLDFIGNTAGADGGAIYANGDHLELKNLVGGTLTLSRNLSRLSGGALSTSGTLNLSGSYGAIVIASNTVSAGSGGAFYAGNLSLSTTVAGNLSINNNSANYNYGGRGGAIYTSGNLELNNRVGGTLSLSGNRASSNSGAVYSNKNITLGGSYGAIMIASNSTAGYSDSSAGALYASGSIILSATVAGNLSISGNSARDYAGAFLAFKAIELNNRVTGTLNISNNTAATTGAGAFYTQDNNITLSGSYGAIAITSNTAARDGGAFLTGYGAIILTTTVGGNLNISGNSAVRDGGVFCATSGSITLNNSVAGNLNVSGNRSGQDGGAFFASQNITLNHRVGGTLSFSNNYAARAGGAIDADGALNLSGSYRAILITSNTAGEVGGAFYAGNGFNLTLAASSTLTASGNKAPTNDDGGFLYVDRGDLVFDLGANAFAQIGNVNSIANQTDSIAIYASVSVYKRGAGTLQLWANNPFSDNFYVNAGTLDLRGKLSSNRTEVSNGATLKGSGTTIGSVVIYSGGTLAPGDGPGVLTTGTLTLNDGAALSLNLAAATGANHTRPANNSLLVVNGNLTSVGTAQIDLTLTAGPVNGAVYDLIKYSGNVSGNVNLRKLSGSGATGVKISDFKIVNSETGWLKLSYSGTTVTTGTGGGNGGGTEETWDLAGLTSKGLKLSAAKTLVVPKGVKLLKGTKAIYTWKRDGATVLSGSGKNFTAKDSGTYTLTLSYTTADGQQHSQTQNFGKLKLFAQPKTATLTMTQTTDTITNSALRGTSVVSGETLKLTASVGTVGGGAVGPFRYVWYCGSAVVRTQQSSATTDTFTTPAYGDKAVGYKCVVELVAKDAKNKPLGTAKSKDLKAKIILPPSAVTLSASATTVKENGTLTLSASAKGTAALTFTWYKNGAQIATGSAKKFAKKPVTVSDAGTYYVVVSQDKTTRRAQSAPLTVSVQRADGSIAQGNGGVPPPSATPMAAASPADDPRRRDAAATLSDSAGSNNSAGATILNLAPLKLSAGDVLTLSGSATREYIIVSETQHSTGAYHYEWRDNLTAEFQDAEAAEVQLILHFITSDGGVYELSASGSVNETGVFELRKK